MNKSRHILAVLAVTVALCADQIASAAPLPKAPVVEIAARLVLRLSESFPKTIARDVRPEVRTERYTADANFAPAAAVLAIGAHREVSPFQFRLPPPIL